MSFASDEELYDDIDKYHLNNQKQGSRGDLFGDDEQEENQSVFPVLDSDNEDEQTTNLSHKWQKLMDQDDLEETDETKLDNDDHWGQKKSLYYNSDSAFAKKADPSKGIKMSKIEREQELKEFMKMEEEEALLLQKQLMEELKDEDFGHDFVEDMIEKEKKISQKSKSLRKLSINKKPFEDTSSQDKPTLLYRDLNEMTKKEKIALIKRESPEFISWSKAATKWSKELSAELYPLLNAYEYYQVIQNNSDAIYIKNDSLFHADFHTLQTMFSSMDRNFVTLLAIKKHLIGLYLVNYAYYLYAKVDVSDDISVRQNIYSHPVFHRIQTYHKVVAYVDTLIVQYYHDLFLKLKENLDTLPKCFHTERLDVRLNLNSNKSRKYDTMEDYYFDVFGYHPNRSPLPALARLKQENTLAQIVSESALESIEYIPPTSTTIRTPNDMLANRKIQNKSLKPHAKSVRFNDVAQGPIGGQLDSNTKDKRPINYEMAKNKGLTPKRKKEYRNPRVKHKLRYKKALTKHRSQNKIARKELNKYSGEKTGIKVGLRRSIKIK